MPSKRKTPSLGLERRVRPRREDDWEPGPEVSEESSEDEGAEEEEIRGEAEDGDDASDSGSDSGSGSAESDQDAAPKVDFSAVSFGALARAQASLPATDRKSKKTKPSTAADQQAELDSKNPIAWPAKPAARPKPPKRSSKHAPQEQTSKKPVSRRREILPDGRRQARDPRFETLARPLDEAKARRAYAFLDEYRESEMAELRADVKKAKDPAQKEALKRQLLSMESKKKAQKKRDEEENLLGEHRRKEKELVAQGKTPFYLKKSEQKKQLLTERFASMSKGQVDRAIERKRKKVVGKEKKELGSLERVRNRH